MITLTETEKKLITAARQESRVTTFVQVSLSQQLQPKVVRCFVDLGHLNNANDKELTQVIANDMAKDLIRVYPHWGIGEVFLALDWGIAEVQVKIFCRKTYLEFFKRYDEKRRVAPIADQKKISQSTVDIGKIRREFLHSLSEELIEFKQTGKYPSFDGGGRKLGVLIEMGLVPAHLMNWERFKADAEQLVSRERSRGVLIDRFESRLMAPRDLETKAKLICLHRVFEHFRDSGIKINPDSYAKVC